MKPEDLFALLPSEYEGKDDFEKAVNNLFDGFGAKELNLEETIKEQKEEITALKVQNYDNMMKNRRNDSEAPPEQPPIIDVNSLFKWQ